MRDGRRAGLSFIHSNLPAEERQSWLLALTPSGPAHLQCPLSRASSTVQLKQGADRFCLSPMAPVWWSSRGLPPFPAHSTGLIQGLSILGSLLPRASNARLGSSHRWLAPCPGSSSGPVWGWSGGYLRLTFFQGMFGY